MVDRQRKKEQKARKRKKKIEKKYAFQRQQEQLAKNRSRYPLIMVTKEGADPEFISLVNDAVRQIKFEDKEQFSDWERKVFRIMAKYGAEYTVNCIKAAASRGIGKEDPAGVAMLPAFLFGLGECIFDLIPETKRRQFLPYNDMRVLLHGQSFLLSFTQLQKSRGVGGSVYYSRHRPKVSINGHDYIVAFSRHAIERICERITPRWLGYTAAGDAHALFSHCVYFESLTLYGGQPAFTFYDICDDESNIHYLTYVKDVLGEDNYDKSKGRPYFRVGYCPVVIEGEFAKATTFLYPGFSSTPEYGAILKSKLPHAEKVRLKNLAMVNDATKTVLDQDVEMIRWFHRNGIPQVIQTHEALFDYRTETLSEAKAEVHVYGL